MGSVYVLVHLLGYVIFSYYPLWSLCSLSQIPMTVWSLILSPRLISVHYQVSSFTVKVSFSLCVLLSLASLVSLFQICSRCVSHLFPLCPVLPCVSSLPERTVQFTSIILSHGLCTDVSLCVSLLVQTWVLFWFLVCLMLVFHQFNNGLAFC